MKRSIFAAAAILVMAGAVRGADFGALSGKTAEAIKAAALKEAALVQVPAPQLAGVGFCSKAASADISAVCREGEAVLRDPGAFTVRQMGDVIVKLDVACSSFPSGSRYRRSLDALRDALDNAQREKVRQHLSGTSKSAALAATVPAPLGAGLDVRKVFVMPDGENWEGPFTVQFSEEASPETVQRILKEEKLEAKELVESGRGLYARIVMKEQFGWTTMDTEFAWMRIMRLTDLTSVSYVAVNKRLWNK